MSEFDRDEPGRIEQPPERIAGTGEMMADRFRAQKRIDPDEQDPRLGRENIASGTAVLNKIVRRN